MTAAQSPRVCLGVPIDHRLEPLLVTGLGLTSPLRESSHANLIESRGRVLQCDRDDISDSEIEFAKWLAMPATKGGVVIVLMQPAEHQSYFADPYQTVKHCETLRAVDDVCRTVTGSGLDSVSCFDAFAFHKTPLNSSNVDEYEAELDKTHRLFLQMIEEKEPNVVFCCYRSPHPDKYQEFQSLRIGHTYDATDPSRGQRYVYVNGFHPGFILHYREDRSALRTLFILEAAQAFRRANGTWREEPWMESLRQRCKDIVRTDATDMWDQPVWARHDIQRARFLVHMDSITEILNSINLGQYHNKNNDQLYEYILEKRYNLLLSDCLLLLIKIGNFEDYIGERLEEKGKAELRQIEERNMRHLRRNVEKRCTELLSAPRADGQIFRAASGENVLLKPENLIWSPPRTGPTTRIYWLYEHVRHCFTELLHLINAAHIDKGKGAYEIDKEKLAKAFSTAAGYLERAMGQHLARKRGWWTEASSEVASPLPSRPANRPGYSHPREAPAQTSAYPQTPPVTPQKPPAAPTPLHSMGPPPTPPHFGLPTPEKSPQTASVTPNYKVYPCRKCHQIGHSFGSCPKTQCYRCKNFGHMTYACPDSPSKRQPGRVERSS